MIPSVRGRHEEINVMTPKKELNSAEYSQLLKKPIKINGRGAVVMIDSGATGNFISEMLVRVWNLPTVGKKEPYQLQMADGSESLLGDVNRETIPLDVAIQRHHEEMTFNMTRMANHHIVLGIP